MKTTALFLISIAVSAHAVTPPKPCAAKDLTLTFKGRNGEFAGMSHDGALLILRNISKHTCTVDLRPELEFSDATGKPVALEARVPPGMHPGPVLMPLTLKPRAAASGKMMWVMGEVFDNSHCIDTAHASLALAEGTVKAPLEAHVCAQAGTTPQYDQEWLKPGIEPLP
jgi:hypothetical protein